MQSVSSSHPFRNASLGNDRNNKETGCMLKGTEQPTVESLFCSSNGTSSNATRGH
jgi:hypothetical protein